MGRTCAAAHGVLVAPGGRRLLRLDLELPCGAVALIHGPNGSGKTLLLRLLAGLGPARIVGEAWAARPLFYAPPGEIHLEGVLVREWYWLHAQPLHPALAGLAGARMEGLSRGWRRLAGLLAPVGSGARVMLLDEPFTGLDDERGLVLAESIARAARRGSLVAIAEPTGAAGRVLGLLRRAGAEPLDCPVAPGGDLRCP